MEEIYFIYKVTEELKENRRTEGTWPTLSEREEAGPTQSRFRGRALEGIKRDIP